MTQQAARRPHVGFVDMTKEHIAGYRVIGRADNSAKGNAQWECRHRCGAIVIIAGTVLRSMPPVYCAACRPTIMRAVRRLDHVCGCTRDTPCPKALRLFIDGAMTSLRWHLDRTLIGRGQ